MIECFVEATDSFLFDALKLLLGLGSILFTLLVADITLLESSCSRRERFTSLEFKLGKKVSQQIKYYIDYGFVYVPSYSE
jgi:hypothetical protein